MTHVFEQEGTLDETPEKVQERYKFDVCNAMTALDPKKLRNYLTGEAIPEMLHLWCLHDLTPSLAAAVGNVEVLRDTLTLGHLLPPHCALFPNALDAAVASNQLVAIKVVLDWIAGNVKDKSEYGSWDQMRTAARVLTRALLVAVRLHKTLAGNMILDFLEKHRTINRSKSKYFEEDMILDSIRYGNIPLLHRAISIHRTDESTAWDPLKPKIWKLSHSELEEIFTKGHKRVLRVFLQTGQLFPNHFEPYKMPSQEYGTPLIKRTPLAYVMDKRRHDLAQVLFANGADVNGIPKNGDGKTALWHAANAGHYKDVHFLLAHGADPDFPKNPKNSPLHIPGITSGFVNKTSFLLQTAKREGKDAIIRDDIWDRYQSRVDELYNNDWY